MFLRSASFEFGGTPVKFIRAPKGVYSSLRRTPAPTTVGVGMRSQSEKWFVSRAYRVLVLIALSLKRAFGTDADVVGLMLG